MKKYVAINAETKEEIKELDTLSEAVKFIGINFLKDPELKIDIYDNVSKRYLRKA